MTFLLSRPRLRPSSARRPIALGILDRRRRFSTSPVASSAEAAPSKTTSQPAPVSERWLSELQSRIGKCIMFGCTPAQVSRAAVVLRALATEWRALTAGSKGYLTGGRRGLEDHKVVWGVMDGFQHVNNVTYIRYAESSRVNWVNNFAVHVDPAHARQWRELMTPQSTGLILKSIKAGFKLPIVYPDTISVYHKLHSPPSSSPFSLDCVILSHRHRRVAARFEEDIVIYDYQTSRKTAMPEFVRRVFADTFRLQEEERHRAAARIRELYGLVGQLEKETWDRADAVEDLGVAGKKT